MQTLASKLDRLIEEINETDINHRIHSLIIKMQIGTHEVGKTSRKGSFTPYYTSALNIRATDDLLMDFRAFYDEYRKLYPTKRTLYFRYNQKSASLQVFSAAGMDHTSLVLVPSISL